MTNQASIHNKEPWISVILSTLFPGVGQIYAGRFVRGGMFLLIAIIFIGIVVWLGLNPLVNLVVVGQVLVGYFVFNIFNLFDAHRCTRKSNNIEFEVARKAEKDPWLGVFLNRFIVGSGYAYQGKWILAILFFVFGYLSSPIVILSVVLLSFGGQADLLATKLSSIYLISVILSYFSIYHVYKISPTQREKQKKSIIFICLILISFDFIIPISIRTFLAEPRFIASSSMNPTLLVDDRLIIDKISFRWRKPERGEIIIFNPPNHPVIPDTSKVYIHRIIGLPRDRISIHNGKVFVNDSPLNEKYISEPTNYTLPSSNDSLCPMCFRPDNVQVDKEHPFFTVPNGQYWVMGDNRNNSLDSHAWGFLPEKNIVGRAMFRYWPRDSRVGNLVIPKY